MISFRILFYNLLFALNNLPGYLLFILGIRMKDTQKKLLAKTLKRNRYCRYGMKYDFSSIKTVAEYQARVPITDYEAYRDYINEIRKGSHNILIKEKVVLLEPTSGTSSAAKLIPYTKNLKKDFIKGISPWLFDMYKNLPKLLAGKSYWSITPSVNTEINGKMEIGFEDDTEYFGIVNRFLLRRLLAVPAEVTGIKNKDAFFYVTLLFLLKSKDLSFISVWSPTMINLLLDPLSSSYDKLIDDLGSGRINKEFVINDDVRTIIEKKLGKNHHRAEEVRAIINEREKNIYEKIWPNIRLISCWSDANSAYYAKKIRKYFPHAIIQGKGLLATECIVSFPFRKGGKKILSIRSHFFEFRDVLDNKIYLSHELWPERDYSVITTTSGGLYRYEIGDIIKVLGYIKRVPLIEFVRRGNNLDLFGEKLNEEFVKEILEDVFIKYDVRPSFYMIAPEERIDQIYYTLFIKCDNLDADYASINQCVDEGLRRNFHYNYCQQIGQLQRLRTFIIKGNGMEKYVDRCRLRGQRIGNIKPLLFSKELNWSEYFDGSFAD